MLLLQTPDLRKGRPWSGPVTNSRHHRGAYYTTVTQLFNEDEDGDLACNRVGTFRNYFRMTRGQFDIILAEVEPLISKQDTVFRESISAEERLMVTLRYLATGSSMTQLHYDWCISVASLSSIIPETCEAIYSTMRHDYLKTPTTQDKWKQISNDLEENWNFPNALGRPTFCRN